MVLIVGVHGKYGHGKNWFVSEALDAAYDVKKTQFAFADALKEMAAVLLAVDIDTFYIQTLKEMPLPSFINMTETEFIVRISNAISILTGVPTERVIAYHQNNIYIDEFSMHMEEIVFGMVMSLMPYYNHNVKSEKCELKEGTYGLFCQWLGTEVVRRNICQDAWVEIVRRKIESTTAKLVFITDVRFPNETRMVREMGGLVIRVEAPELVLGSRDPDHPSETALDDVNFRTFENNRLPEHDKMPFMIFSPEFMCMAEVNIRSGFRARGKIVCAYNGWVFYRGGGKTDYKESVMARLLSLPYRRSKFSRSQNSA